MFIELRKMLQKLAAPLGIDSDQLLIVLASAIALVIALIVGVLIMGRTRGSDKVRKQKSLDQASALARKGQLDEAGDLFWKLEEWEAAAVAWAKAGRWKKAVEAARRCPKTDLQAHVFEGAGLYGEAAAILEKQRKFEAAAMILSKGKLFGPAAEMWERTGNLANAIKMYYAAGLWEKAARAAARSKDYPTAAKILLHGIETTRKANDKPPVNLVILASDALLKSGARDKALMLLIKEGIDAEVIRIAENAKIGILAARMALAEGKGQLAAKLSALTENPDVALRVKAEAMRDEDPFIAADLYAQAGDPLKAAELFASSGHYGEAAQMYEKGENYGQALDYFRKARDRLGVARTLEKTGQYAEAAEAYGRTGNLEKAMELFQKGGNPLSAARVALKLNRTEQGLKLLEGINDKNVDYIAGSLLKGQTLLAMGKRSEAVESLRVGLADEKVDPQNLGIWYQLALGLEENSDFVEAYRIVRRIVRADPHYRDVGARLKQIAPKASAVAVDDDVPSETRTMNVSRPQRYVILGEIGRGGMGVVYKAHDTQLDRIVAYKVLPDELKKHQKAVENFMREARSAASLTHVNIVIVHDVGEDNGVAFMVMEFLEGVDCKTLLREKGSLDLATALSIVVQVAEGLQYAHDKKLVHRDIKPSNLMRLADGQIKIMDFGLAKVVREVVNFQTMVGGTPFYMSPEQVKGGSVDARADLYSLGVSLFEMVTGQVPYPRGEIGYLHVHGEIPHICDIQPELPQELDAIVFKLMAKDPKDRYQNAGELINALKQVL